MVFDSKSTWSSHVAAVCKSMPYYLYLSNFHSKSLTHEILKMLVESLVFSRLNYALLVWGPAVHQNSASRINHLHNRAVCIVCGLCKSEHVSRHHRAIGWLSMPLLTQHRTSCAMLDQYTCLGILLNPPIKFVHHHTYATRCTVHSAMIVRCRLALSKRHFYQKAITWWSSLPQQLFSDLLIFRHNLYKYLRCML